MCRWIISRHIWILVLGFLISCGLADAKPDSPRSRISFNRGWKFMLQDVPGAEKPDCDDSAWGPVDLPHDWAIGGPFNKDLLEEGGLPFPGVGWYRKSFTIAPRDSDKVVYVEFDGVMRDAQVWLNGHYIGNWPYGYSSFAFDLSPYLHSGEQANVMAVRVENVANSSRWYPGSGIYRNVRLSITDPVHVAHWGTYITTPVVSATEATIRAHTTVENQGTREKTVILETAIYDAKGRKRASGVASAKVDGQGRHEFDQPLTVKQPKRWDIEHPHLYHAVTTVKVADMTVDEYTTSFGIRTFYFDADSGFFLNGRNLKIKGVNLHHDLGPLGIAVSRRAIERQLEILKEMGCNAIRSAHNPPAPELLELCDEMGFLVIDEAFDEWRKGKKKFGYNRWFDQWAEKDLRAMIRRDRNHPSIILWSIGNELREQRDLVQGRSIARFLTDICHEEDPTRPVTAAISRFAPEILAEGLASVIDVVGWNYQWKRYRAAHQAFPDRKQLATETSAVLSTRGVYHFPVEPYRRHESNQVTSYDFLTLGFGAPPDSEFFALEQNPFVAGEFVWSGFDYLGEPEPYEDIARSTYFGIVDLCGFPKDRYYLYQSQWTTEPMVHLLPHWTWPEREGEITPVYCYTNCPSAELFVNSVSMGRKTKRPGEYRLKWEQVTYQPGTLEIVAYDENGDAVCREMIRTAGDPAQIKLTSDRTTVMADGTDLAFITVRITDQEGNFCPRANNLVKFQLAGPAQIAGVGNGNPLSFEPFQTDHRRAFNGLCLLILRAETGPGEILITATADGLASGHLALRSRR